MNFTCAAQSSSILNLLEPEGIVDAFFAEPPEEFEPVSIDVNGKHLHGFLAELDLFTTADEKIKRFYQKHKDLLPAPIARLFNPKVLFIGTTVSEYALFPCDIDLKQLKDSALSRLHNAGLQFLIIKDIPMVSPFLADKENDFSELLIPFLEKNGFFIVSGQALAYVPITFRSIDEYLQRFSRSRRKDIKRKLRSISEISIEQVNTGDDFFNESAIKLLYELYLNVYDKSDVHFDRLTLPFFRKVFKDKECGGVVFLYRHQDRIIGFNLCFIARDYLLDKYVGFLYPDSQKYNLYFVSWIYNLNFCIQNNLKSFIAGWTDPGIKSYLGAEFNYTYHAVYIRNTFLRFIFNKFKSFFESDRHVLEETKNKQ